MDIKREELLNSLKDFTLRGNGIVIGLPGVGKTYIIKELEKSLNINELSAVYLRVDRLANCTNDDLRAIFSFKGDFIENLHKQKPVSGKRFVIFFDGFDAMRNEVGRENLLILIHKSLIELKDDWNVIVSVRTYDAHKSQALLALFDKPLSDDEEIYKDKNIPCRHFEIKPLTETEIEDGLNQIHFPNELFLQSSDDFKSLLSIPFNLLLLEKYRYLGGKFSDLSNVKTEVHLLNSYWNIRSNNANDLNLQDLLLERITHKMVDQRTLTINKNQVVDSHTSLIADRLLSDGVLEKVDSKGQEIGFSHNILFDYAANVYQLNNDINVLVGYLNNDLSKMVFLLPGLSFHFTEMYYENPKAFWDSYRFLISNSNIHLKLLGRVIFTTVIVNETYSIKQLQSIIDFPKDLLNIMYKSMIYILQAIRALNSKRLDLWISFLENINFFSDISIAWEVSLLIRWMYDQNNNEIDVVARIGTLARKLLDWVQTNQGNKYDLNRLGARVLTPLVANTFSTNPQESKSLLGNILNNIESPDYPIDYIYEITNHVKDYWTSSPEFVEQIYQKIFGHKEISDEITEFGSPILPLRSNRRQDFSMCQYLLIWAFKDFLASSPLKAISAGVKAIDSYIIRERVNPLMNHDESSTTQSEEEFHFFGSKAVFIKDFYFISDNYSHIDEPIQIADLIFEYISDLASKSRLEEINQVLLILRENAKIGYFWSHLLSVAILHSKLFASYLFDLCIAAPILSNTETQDLIGTFIEKVFSEYTSDQQLQIEKAILALIPLHRDKLLFHIPIQLIRNKEAIVIRRQNEQKRKNDYDVSVVAKDKFNEFSLSQKDNEEKEKETLSPDENIIQNYISEFSLFVNKWNNLVPSIDETNKVMPCLKSFYDTLSNYKNNNENLSRKAWTKLGEATSIIVKNPLNNEDPHYQLVKNILLNCASNPHPKSTEVIEEKYSFPSWSPDPRIEAAKSLSRLLLSSTDHEVVETINLLIKDPVPSVRYLLFYELWRIAEKTPKEYWEIISSAAQSERNSVVRQAICLSIGNSLHLDEQKGVNALQYLFMNNSQEDKESELIRFEAQLIMSLYFIKENSWALETINKALANPINHLSLLFYAASFTVRFLRPENIENKIMVDLIKKSRLWLGSLIQNIEIDIFRIHSIPPEKQNESTGQQLIGLYKIIDEIVARLYFMSDVNENIRKKDQKPLSIELKNKYYQEIKSTLHLLLQDFQGNQSILPAHTSHYFMQMLNGLLHFDPEGVLEMASLVAKSGRLYGYNLDALAMEEVVKLVEKILVDYRYKLRDNKTIRNILDLLDIFIDVGWPEALKLVWRLDVIFR